jgi:hypothetical protein
MSTNSPSFITPIILDNSSNNSNQSNRSQMVPPSVQTSIPLSVPPSVQTSISLSVPPSFSQNMTPSLANNQNNICDCSPKYNPPSIILKCDSTNISYESGNLNQCTCPSNTRVFKLTENNEINFNISRFGNGTYNRLTKMCSLNNTKIMITDKNGQSETICVDDVYSNITGGSVKKHWCSNK